MGTGARMVDEQAGTADDFKGRESDMNIYEKLLSMRVDFLGMGIKKSGYNNFSKYAYFELDDLVPPITNLCNKYRCLTHVSFSKEYAVLTLIDVERPEEKIHFNSPMGKADIKGTVEIQQIGGAEKYQRRYLYLILMDVIEHDAIDASPPVPEKTLIEQAYEAMSNCEDIASLQKVFANFYRRADDKQKTVIKTDYDILKEGMEKEDSNGINQ